MIANYHTHTWRCMHAEGTEREYVERAIEGGLKILGFSDHTPMPYANGYVSNVKMRLNQLEGYVDTVLNLKKEYEKDIEIHLGLEVEYYPKYLRSFSISRVSIRSNISRWPSIFSEMRSDDVYSGDETQDPKILERYCLQCREGHADGLLYLFCPPGSSSFTGDPAVYDHWMRGALRGCERQAFRWRSISWGSAATVITRNPAFWKIVGEVGNPVIFGSDAHEPDKVWNPAALKKERRS
ncbi:MAG: PHP domain-containing protein [Lachnospiraceae bacterium]